MGLLQKWREFKEGRYQKQLAKNLKLLQNPKAIREERVGAIEYFCDLADTEKAVSALLKRFDYSLEHGINDTREKEKAFSGIASHKESALPLIKAHLLESDRIAWPLKVYTAVSSPEQVQQVLEDCLDFGEVEFDQKKVDKNYDILCYLRDYKLSLSTTVKLLHFLNQHDERVRFAAVEALLEQNYPEIYEKLEPFLLDQSPENIRIRQAVADAFLEKRWTLKNRTNFTPGPLMPGITLGKNFQLEAQ